MNQQLLPGTEEAYNTTTQGEKEGSIKVSEQFFSLQGEGPSIGKPSLFLRLQNCTLECVFCPTTGYVVIEGKGRRNIKHVKVGDRLLCVDDKLAVSWTAVTNLELEKVQKVFKLELLGEKTTPIRAMWNRLHFTAKSRLLLSDGSYEFIENLKPGQILYATKGNEYASLRMKEKNPSSSAEGRAKLRARVISPETKERQSKVRLSLLASGKIKPAVMSEEGRQRNSERMKAKNPSFDIEIRTRSTETKRKNWKAGLYKAYERDGEWRKHASARMLGSKNPMKKFENVLKVIQRRKDRPTLMEKKFMALLELNNLASKVKYVGNGKFWLGKKNPDFLIEGENKVIELIDSTMPGRDAATYSMERKSAFEKDNYKCLVLDWAQKAPRCEQSRNARLVQSVQGFIHNGAIVRKVKEIDLCTLPGVQRNQLQTSYKITCEPHPNYIVGQVVHHNCDTLEVWKRGNPFSFKELVAKWKEEQWHDKLVSGHSHLIITGGSPLMQQKELALFLSTYKGKRQFPYVEIETECVLKPKPEIDQYVNQYNVSPKLQNSGMPEIKRVRPDTIKFHAKDPRSYFKFVVETEKCVQEMEDTYIIPYKIPPSRVYLMPEGQTVDALQGRYQWMAEVCKQKGYNFTTRLQVLIWGKTTGV